MSTRFCSACGEEPVPAKDLTFRGRAEKVVHGFTSIDAKALRTVWRLLRHPGDLTLAWVRGVRKPYVAPFALFLLANVIFFFLQWLTGVTVFSSTLDSHIHVQDWSEPAQTLLSKRLAATHRTLEQFAPAFDRAVILYGKSLVVLMTIPFAALLPLAFFRERRSFMVHVVFALHVYAFLLLLFCVAMLAATASAWMGLGGLESPRVDNVLSVFNLLACAAYLYVAIGPVYGASGLSRVAQATALAIGAAVIVLGYRFVLFLITLYMT